MAFCCGLLAASADLSVGFAGMLNLGLAFPFAIGCYTSAVGLHYHLPFFVTILIAAGISVAILMLLGAICFRRGVPPLQYALAGLVLSLTFEQIAVRSYDWLGGSNGVAGIPKPHLLINFGLPNGLDYLVGALLLAVVTTFVIHKVAKSRLGHILEGIREGEDRMQTLGYDVLWNKLILVGCTAALGALAGCLYVPFAGIADPTLFSLIPNLEVLIWLAVGGMRSIYGPFLCAVILRLVRFELGSHFEQLYTLAIGLIYLLVVLYKPGGASSIFERWSGEASKERVT
jgi:ABC-type branched-subunit amino acid transport system permease subunit